MNPLPISHVIEHLERCIDRTAIEKEKPSGEIMDGMRHMKTGDSGQLMKKASGVISYLMKNPYANAEMVSRKTETDPSAMKIIYRAIASSQRLQTYMRASENADYFRIVDHYFNQRLFTVVFFVGISCPNRCIFCPNVRVEKDGKRSIVQYESDGKEILTQKSYESVFDDLDTIREKSNMKILVKISGGLEPLTDIDTIEHITRLSQKRGFHVKLFTNGTLLNTEKRRDVALGTKDIRISLSTTDKDQYEWICFGDKKENNHIFALDLLKRNLKEMVRDRDKKQYSCKIGLNAIVMPSNCDDMIPLIEMASDLGLDSVDLKPRYFVETDENENRHLEKTMDQVKSMLVNNRYHSVYVGIADSLYHRNLYWHPWEGVCHIQKQSRFKMFVTPYGDLSPVHHGAFPSSEKACKREKENYVIGTLSDDSRFLECLRSPNEVSGIPLKKLNPFELMLHLETQRREDDLKWGLSAEHDPFNRLFE